MPAAERGVVKPPNEGEWKNNDARANGFLPLADHPSDCHPPNYGPGGDRRGGSYSLAGEASTVHPSNRSLGGDRRGFSGDAEMPAAVEPGKGAVPVNPFLAGGGMARAMPVADMAEGKLRK
jgi:hypothetical protein